MAYSYTSADEILRENARRWKAINTPIDQITGEGLPLSGERALLRISDFKIKKQWVPKEMLKDEVIAKLNRSSIRVFLKKGGVKPEDEDYEDCRECIARYILRTRCYYDFPFWAVMYVRIKNKSGGPDIPFRMRRAQFKLFDIIQGMIDREEPIHIILLKSRQWGGSTLVQVVMAWIQLMRKTAWNSITVGHIGATSAEVKGMFTKLMDHYPLWLLYGDREEYNPKDPKVRPFEGSSSIDIVPARNFKVKVGTAESPNSARGGDSNMTHCTEVAFWKKTDNKTPEELVRSACSGKQHIPLELEVYESTANGSGDFFHGEWLRAVEGQSDKTPVFVAWYETDLFVKLDDAKAFAQRLIDGRGDEDRSKVVWGSFLYNLFEKGATLESINWYILESKKYKDHASLAAEYPSDSVEAFANSGQMVFDMYILSEMRQNMCQPPIAIGDIKAAGQEGEDALRGIVFAPDEKGDMDIWEFPDTEMDVSDRYVVTVDIGGRGEKADYSDILVIDRYWMMEADLPRVVAEWHGHIRHDLLAWKAAQIARWYNDALLVIESNTMETKEKERQLDGNLAPYILDILSEHYDNLYSRPAQQGSGRIMEGRDVMWGFHTNTSTKPAIINNLQRLVEEKGYVERCEDAITEMSYYEKRENGEYGNKPGDNRHDDRVMARAIGLWVSQKMPLPKIREKHEMTISKPLTEASI